MKGETGKSRPFEQGSEDKRLSVIEIKILIAVFATSCFIC